MHGTLQSTPGVLHFSTFIFPRHLLTPNFLREHSERQWLKVFSATIPGWGRSFSLMFSSLAPGSAEGPMAEWTKWLSLWPPPPKPSTPSCRRVTGLSKICAQGRERVREGVPTDEHTSSPEHRPVSGRHLLSRLATSRPRHGAAADESSRPAGSRYAAPSRRRPAPSLLLHGSQVLRIAGRGSRPGLPARAIAAHHPPWLVSEKCSPEFGDGRPGRGSYRASYESCSHHDKGPRGPWSTCHRRFLKKSRNMMPALISSLLELSLFSRLVKPSPVILWHPHMLKRRVD